MININREQETYKILRHCAKGNYKYVALAFDPKYEDQIVKSVFSYTTNFFILRTKHKLELASYNIIYCNTGNVSTILENIFNDKEKEYPFDNDCLNIFSYIIFMQTVGSPPNITLIHFTIDEFMDIYKSGKILSLLEKFYKICTYIIYNDFLFLVFCDKDEVVVHKNLYTIFKENLGVGDYFIIHSLRYEYFKNADIKNTYIISYDKFNDNFDYRLFEKMHELKYNNTKILDFWLNNFKDDYSATIASFESSNPCHAYDVWVNRLNIHINDVYKHSDVLKNIILNNMPVHEKEYIDTLLENKQYIGFQFYTGKQSEFNYEDKRVWDEENVTSFLELCHNNSMNIIILSPHPYREFAGCLNLPKMSVHSYSYAISKLKFVISIDSSSGHIASFYNIPSLTLWGATSPTQYYDMDIGFRPLRNNFSIASKERKMKNIKAEYVYEILCNLMQNNNINNPDKIITYQDSLDAYNIIYVD